MFVNQLSKNTNNAVLSKIVYLFIQKIKRIIHNDLYKFIILILCLFAYSYFSLVAGGFQIKLSNIIFVFLLFFIPLFVSNYKVFRYLIIIHGIIYVLYMPTGRIWGRVDNNILSSLLGTNLSEGMDFFKLVPAKYFIESLFFIFLIFVLLKISKSIKTFNKPKDEIKTLTIVTMYVCMYVCMLLLDSKQYRSI